MVGCAFLHDISHQLSVAKGNDLAFGGISVVFAGDFAQLPPVGQKRLYAKLTQKDISQAGTKYGQKVVFGKLLWLSVSTVVMLTQNMRQTGPDNQPFVELLGRLREGHINWQSKRWKNAPVIVAENAMKDTINTSMAHGFSISSGSPLHWYYATD
ncbi:hypothetical protein B0H16DRAFT_1220551, partial [Mycena metata]